MRNGKPLVIDGYSGLGGWSEAFISEGWECIGIDIEAHNYGNGGYPGHLILQDMRTVKGEQFKDADCLVFSPPCTEYSYMSMPWTRAKQIQKALLGKGEFPKGYKGSRTIPELTDLFNQCFRIQREVSAAAGHYVPLIVENVRGAQEWVGTARWAWGSFYLWGDVPALMPIPAKINWSDQTKRGQDFTRIAGRQAKEGVKMKDQDGYDYPERTFGWKAPATTSKSSARKQASAEIAKIPKPLAQWIARCFK